MDTTRLKDKVAIVTGASSGIGRATVVRFVQEGAKVIAAGRSGRQNELAASYPDSVVAVHCEVADPKQIDDMIAVCRERFGRLDIIVNNAGTTGAIGRAHEYEIAKWDDVMNSNLRGPFLVMRAGIPLMLEGGGGSIVNVASVSSFIASPGSAAYPPSKGGLLMLTKQEAIAYIKDNIRINAVCPGLVRTPILDTAPVGLDVLSQIVPMGRLGEPEEIAPLIAYLASDESSFVTGAAYLIDGGQTAT